MKNFRLRSVLPAVSLALMVISASATISEAQTSFTPPPIPTDNTAVATPPPAPVDTAATPPPPPPAEQFFVSVDGSTDGPFSMSELQSKLTAGTFTASTYVWQDGMSDWMRASDVDKLAPLLATAQAALQVASTPNIETFLTGIWEDKNTTFVAGLGQVQLDMEIEYYPGGTWDGVGTFTSNNNGTSSVYDVFFEGTWSVETSSGDQFSLRTQAKVSIGLVESPVYTDFFDMDETTAYMRTGPNSFRDVEDGLTYTRQ